VVREAQQMWEPILTTPVLCSGYVLDYCYQWSHTESRCSFITFLFQTNEGSISFLEMLSAAVREYLEEKP